MTDSIVHEKICRGCGECKDVSQYYRCTSAKDGLMYKCKLCMNAQRKAYMATPAGKASKAKSCRNYYATESGRTKVVARQRGYYHTERAIAKRASDEAKAKRNQYAVEHRKTDNFKRYILKRRYGITLEYYKQLMKEQGEACAICRKPNVCDKVLVVDHDHQTGKVRGLLCNPCNAILGRWKDSPEAAERARKYLLRHQQLKLVV